MRTNKIIYYASTGLLTVLMLFSAGMYIFNHEEIVQAFNMLGHPSYIIYPLAALKLLGIITLWTQRNTALAEWAYAGFFFNFVLAFSAHISVGDGEFGGALMALIFLFTSYVTSKRI